MTLGSRAAERVTWSRALYRNDFDSFVFLAPTGTPSGNLPVFNCRRGHTTLDGFEAKAQMPLLEAASRPFTRLRTAAEMRRRWGDWVVEASAWHYLRQRQTAPVETPTGPATGCSAPRCHRTGR
jgi:hypothetical protein